ncbi:PREDICTED: putative sodium-dependent multivitamin transporter [Cyphomyrmex costatus]|uniref:Putative sodium-dependent multivitamin transporter n=1 Tax=Cyphomyrmex costatus TaxID=456900 RepID=A0A195C714_9HYME|nr:PREDICTED: putative sodium-dependent multivitamin transporter [Cyphomyrmex costatus]KYM96632.1 Putative sodium-dependent multivitamin transporter [Cyphomyrmex costatus]
MAEINTLGWFDYLVIAMMLCISVGIGIYYRFSGGRQKTMEEYFIANRSMNVLPVAIAMASSGVSAVGFLGSSAEIYTYGTQIVGLNLGYFLSIPILCYGFLPVFFKLQATSIYEYLGKRFGVRVRTMASFAYWIQQIFYSGLILYAPSLALEATTGISKTVSIIIIGSICAFYSSIGGIKAVLITDVFQSLLMFAAVILIISIAANDVGGLQQIWEIARQGQRLEFDSIDLDPTVRHTWWSVTLGGICIFLTLIGVNQVQIQRIMTLKNMQAAQRAEWLCCSILIFFIIIICFSGLAIYSKYYNCDPFLEKRITSPDMLMPLYVMDSMSNISGLPGLFVAGIFSAGLSTISAVLNSLAAVTLEDYLKPLYIKCSGNELSPATSILVAKMLSFTFGILSVILAFLVQYLDGLFQVFFTLSGIIGGPLLGIFTLGMSTESATEEGAITGALISFSFLLWIAFGQPRPIPPKLPTTIEGCNNNVNISNLQISHTHSFFKSTNDSSYFYLYRISYMWYCPLGLLITFILGLFVSNLSRLFIKNQNDELDTNLFFPIIARRMRYRRRNNIKNKGNSPLNRRYSLSDIIHGKDDTADVRALAADTALI